MTSAHRAAGVWRVRVWQSADPSRLAPLASLDHPGDVFAHAALDAAIVCGCGTDSRFLDDVSRRAGLRYRFGGRADEALETTSVILSRHPIGERLTVCLSDAAPRSDLLLFSIGHGDARLRAACVLFGPPGLMRWRQMRRFSDLLQRPRLAPELVVCNPGLWLRHLVRLRDLKRITGNERRRHGGRSSLTVMASARLLAEQTQKPEATAGLSTAASDLRVAVADRMPAPPT